MIKGKNNKKCLQGAKKVEKYSKRTRRVLFMFKGVNQRRNLKRFENSEKGKGEMDKKVNK